MADDEFLAARFEVLEPWVEGEIYRTGKGKLLTPAARANVAAEVPRARGAARHRAPAGGARPGGSGRAGAWQAGSS